MSEDERETPLRIGKLMLEQSVLEKQISALRDELSCGRERSPCRRAIEADEHKAIRAQ